MEFGRRLFGEQIRREPATLKEQYRKFQYYQTTHYKLGLMEHDRLWGEEPSVKEAVRRLRISEPELWDERSFRISRAINFEIKRMFLPKEEWLELKMMFLIYNHFLLKLNVNKLNNDTGKKFWVKNNFFSKEKHFPFSVFSFSLSCSFHL